MCSIFISYIILNSRYYGYSFFFFFFVFFARCDIIRFDFDTIRFHCSDRSSVFIKNAECLYIIIICKIITLYMGTTHMPQLVGNVHVINLLISPKSETISVAQNMIVPLHFLQMNCRRRRQARARTHKGILSALAHTHSNEYTRTPPVSVCGVIPQL